MNRIFHFSDPHLSFNEKGTVMKPMDQRKGTEGAPSYVGYLDKLIAAQSQIFEDDFQVVTGDLVHDMSRTLAPYSLHWMDDNLRGIVVACEGNHDRSIDLSKIRAKHSFKRLHLLAIGEMKALGPYVFGCFSDHRKPENAHGTKDEPIKDPNTKDWYSNDPDELLEFAENLVKLATKMGKVPVLISHYPPSQTQDRLGAMGIKAYLHGHVHVTNNKVEGGIDWKWYDDACRHTDDKVFNGCFVSCGSTDVLLAKHGKIIKEIPILHDVSKLAVMEKRESREAAAIEMNCHPSMAKPFSRQDPLNPENVITGFINVNKGPMQGSLYITRVNDKEVTPQLIYGVPKMKIPYKGDTMQLVAPEADHYLFMKKWNGTNVLIFKYFDSFGRMFITAKSKGAPLLSDSCYGNYLSMAQEVLKRDTVMSTVFANHLQQDGNQSISCELCGTKEPHLVKYDFDIALKPLFQTTNQGKIKVWLSITAQRDTFQTKVTTGVDTALAVMAELKRFAFNENEKFRTENSLQVKYEYNHFALEGYVMYPLDRDGYVIDRSEIAKVKPKDIEEVHWANFNNEMEGRVREAVAKMKDQGLKCTELTVREELDMGPKEWGKFGREIMRYVTDIEGRTNEVIILVGLPGAGKSTYAKEYAKAHEYVLICQDELGSANACKEAMAQALKEGRNVIIDRTNINVQQRKRWIDLAHKCGVNKINAIFFDTPFDVCVKRIQERKGHPTINDDIPFERREEIVHSFMDSFEQPKMEEGFISVETFVEKK